MGQSAKDLKRKALIEQMTEWLSVLRSALGVNQNEMAALAGISRQTYSAIETGKKSMNWNTFLSLFLLCYVNEKTKILMGKDPNFIRAVVSMLCLDPSKLNENSPDNAR